MAYDQWKTTEPEPSEDVQLCERCGSLFSQRSMWTPDKGETWICEDCVDDPTIFADEPDQP